MCNCFLFKNLCAASSVHFQTHMNCPLGKINKLSIVRLSVSFRDCLTSGVTDGSTQYFLPQKKMYFKDKEEIFSRRKRKMLRKRLVYLISSLNAPVGAA